MIPGMPAYLIVTTDIHDPEAYDRYKAAVPAFIRKHGGEYLARGGAVEIFEGTWMPPRIVLLRFPSMAHIRAFLDDPEYSPWKALRHSAAETNLVGVEGLA